MTKIMLLLQTCIKGFLNLRKLRFGERFGFWFMIWSSNCWIRSSGEADAEEEVRSQEVEEEKFCWVWRAKLTILVVLRKIFLLADLLIAAEIWLTQCFIIFRTFDFLTSPSTNCNLSLICWRKRFLILSPISPVVEQTAARKTRPETSIIIFNNILVNYLSIFSGILLFFKILHRKQYW